MPIEPNERCEYGFRGGVSCNRRKTPGGKFCKQHANHSKNVREVNALGIESTTGGHEIEVGRSIEYILPKERMSFYARVLGPKLKAVLEECAAEYKRHNIDEEILITKAVSRDALIVLDSLHELPDTALPRETRAKLLTEAGSIVNQTMEQATRLVERSAKIHALTADKISPTVVDDMVQQMCRFVYLAFEAKHNSGHPDFTDFDEAVNKILMERISKFDKMISDDLQLPSLKALGTTITPDQQVLAMDDTVPLA